jgi:hypothetical protein
VKVAIIDLGFAGYADRQAEGDLPASLATVDYCAGEFATTEPHGTAVAEIVHEMAPDAELTLICIDSEVTLGQAKDYAKANGIRIVNHSVGWFNAVRGDGGRLRHDRRDRPDARAAGILWSRGGNQAHDHWSQPSTTRTATAPQLHRPTRATPSSSHPADVLRDAWRTLADHQP